MIQAYLVTCVCLLPFICKSKFFVYSYNCSGYLQFPCRIQSNFMGNQFMFVCHKIRIYELKFHVV